MWGVENGQLCSDIVQWGERIFNSPKGDGHFLWTKISMKGPIVDNGTYLRVLETGKNTMHCCFSNFSIKVSLSKLKELHVSLHPWGV